MVRGKAASRIVLLTDFGTADWFVAAIKAVVTGLCPEATVIDLTHEVAPGDIRAGAFVLLVGSKPFPPGTVFLAVVDPGESNPGIAVKAGDKFYVGPDNGLLSFVLQREPESRVHRITSPELVRQPASPTFRGRDILAPAAAHLAAGATLRSLGEATTSPVLLPWPVAVHGREGISGEIVYIDHFGNALTSIDSSALGRLGRPPARFTAATGRTIPFHTTYTDVEQGEAVALVGSEGFVEISINRGNAAQSLGLRVGDRVVMR